jgi:hypothetical protein
MLSASARASISSATLWGLRSDDHVTHDGVLLGDVVQQPLIVSPGHLDRKPVVLNLWDAGVERRVNNDGGHADVLEE